MVLTIAHALQEWHTAPQIILGDYNSTPASLHSLSWLLKAGLWFDVGHNADAWPGGIPGQATAKAHDSQRPARLDDCFCNGTAAQLLRGVRLGEVGVV